MNNLNKSGEKHALRILVSGVYVSQHSAGNVSHVLFDLHDPVVELYSSVTSLTPLSDSRYTLTARDRGRLTKQPASRTSELSGAATLHVEGNDVLLFWVLRPRSGGEGMAMGHSRQMEVCTSGKHRGWDGQVGGLEL